ncbi:6-bladed beta-propeller [Parabacteroides sp.]
MKRSILISVLILSTLLAGCGGNNPSEEELITVDVTKSYPKKELILQDFMDVEYIPLETTDEFICQGLVMAIGKDVILARNRVRDGYIFFFDRKTGKGLKKINREGQGGEEYTFIQRIVLNEEQNEMFVLDHFSRQIVVYDLDGKFKRKLKRGEELYFFHLYDFGQDDLIANNYWVTDKSAFAVVSKQDGNMIEQIQIPFKEKIPIAMSYSDEAKDLYYSVIPNNYNPIIPYFDSWMLVEQSSDTIYKYQSDHKMIPIIARTPSVQSMNPEVFLFLGVLTNRYYFMETVKKEYNFETHEGFPTTDLLYDKQEQAIFEYTVYNNDYSDKRAVNMKTIPVNDEIASWQSIEASLLIEDYENGKLKGRLKEIAASLDEESNPVIMLIKHKK